MRGKKSSEVTYKGLTDYRRSGLNEGLTDYRRSGLNEGLTDYRRSGLKKNRAFAVTIERLRRYTTQTQCPLIALPLLLV